MILRLRACVIAAVAGALDCRGARPREAGDGCPAGFPAAGVPFEADTSRARAALVGTFTVVSLRTTNGLPAARWVERLVLRPTPAAERRYRPAMAPGAEREQPLTGSLQSEDGAAPNPPNVWRLRGRVLVSDNGAGCNDCGTAVYRIERVGTDGFAGSWQTTLSGISLVGPHNRLFDQFGGRFCATRLPTEAGAG